MIQCLFRYKHDKGVMLVVCYGATKMYSKGIRIITREEFYTSIFKYCKLNDHDKIYKPLYEIPSTKLQQDLDGKNVQSMLLGSDGRA